MKLFLLVVASVCVVLSLAQASTSPNVKLTGYVVSFDQNAITIESGNQKFQIPRVMYPDKTKSGELVSVPMTQKEYALLKRGPISKP
jgi:hypothetical protein